MPAEIADSDAESDFNSPIKKTVANDNVADQAANADPSQISLSRYDFDQFLDPTQRLSSLSPQHADGVPTASELLAGLPSGSSELQMAGGLRSTVIRDKESSSAAQGKKRAHSAYQDGSTDLSSNDTTKTMAAKRTKTYAHSSKSRGTLQDVDLFAPLDKDGGPRPGASTGHHSSNGSGEKTSGINVDLSIGSGHPNAAISLLGQSLTGSTHRLSTSSASMGRYESINLDYRNAGQGLDVNANPFGSLSQISSHELHHPEESDPYSTSDPNHEQQMALDTSNLVFERMDENMPDQALSALSQSPPCRPLSVNPSNIMQNDGAMADIPEDEAVHVEAVAFVGAEITAPIDTTEAVLEKLPPKKRGRKPKNPRLASKSPAPGAMDDVEEFVLPDLPPTNRSRQGTVDSVYSQASQASTTNTLIQKRKRGKSKQVGDAAEQAMTAAQESPMKQHELNLSDEALIGLPKDQYKPRPSRSRSKRHADEEEPLLQDMLQQTPAKDKVVEFENTKAETPSGGTAKLSAKKGRKSKVKRAKTSAAALLKRGDPMLSEGEEDVMWMDTKPAPVKLDLPPDLKVLKKETEAGEDEKATVNKTQEEVTSKEDEPKVTVEIPAEAKDTAAAPKKRGRKPKKVQPVSESKVVEEQDDDTETSRPVLAEKSTNVSNNIQEKSKDKEVKAPTVSPLSSPESGAHIRSPEREKDNPPAASELATPSKNPADNGPTTHSPIKPTALSSGKKIIYRVGLSRRQHIPSLLRKVQRDKPPPTVVVRKEKENKKKKNGDDDEGENRDELRGADGMLVEWDF
ncbi:hypothetical protein LTS15_008535 [Exophiala xenobiotica]|nr:hypothetical protein LTS15_008535 [Exophiala xenobiotica]